MGPVNHELNCRPEFFEAIRLGNKTFEIREQTYYDFRPSDTLTLCEFSIDEAGYSGRSLQVEVTYVMEGPVFGLLANYCVMSIRVIEERAEAAK